MLLLFLTVYNRNQTTSTAFDNLEKSFYFECSDREIISFIGRCDGRIDCSNGKDEDNCQMVYGMYV